MPRPSIIALCLAVALPVAAVEAADQAYRWVDEDGVVHYSDQPHPGAEEVELESAPTTRLAPPRSIVRRPSAEPADGDADDAANEYESLTIASPAAEETLWNIGGVLTVTLDLQPALQSGHQVRVYFDGTPRTVSGTQFQLQEVWRGTHNLQAEVVDVDGNLLIRSEPIRFHVQQTSIINPPGA